MKRKVFSILAVLALYVTVFSACNSIHANASIKTITRPYIAQYECTEARYGDTNLLDYYDYIKIIFLNKDEFELTFKPKGEEKKTYSGNYSVDPQTRELEGDMGILGYNFKEKVKVENGKFVISKTLGEKELYIKFEIK